MNTEEHIGYYAIIPADVRYADISPNAKLMYGEITALVNKTGFCWASSSYFSELYGVTDRAVRNWVKELEELGVIKLEIVGNTRKIFLCRDGKNIPQTRKKFSASLGKNFPHNNTSNNNKIFRKPTKQEVEEYSKEINFTLDASYFIDFYEARGWMIGKTKMKDWKAAVRTWKSKQKEIEPTKKKDDLFQAKSKEELDAYLYG